MALIYLHGFASSPYGRKGTFFRDQCAAHDIAFRAPNLNAPSFERLTISDCIKRTGATVKSVSRGEPIYLVGSSMGGLVALHFMEQHKAAERIEKILLLAPAFEMAERWSERLDNMAEWRITGWMNVYHYAYEEDVRLHYGFYEDCLQYDGFSAVPDVPIHIIHGRYDDSVPAHLSERYAAAHDNVSIEVVESDHGLTDSRNHLWAEAVCFFGLD